jgi:hypothetical protein
LTSWRAVQSGDVVVPDLHAYAMGEVHP